MTLSNSACLPLDLFGPRPATSAPQPRWRSNWHSDLRDCDAVLEPGRDADCPRGRLQNQAREQGPNLDRLRRRAVFEMMLIQLNITRQAIWVLKGGTPIEV